jgi:hypothetical protein
MSASAAVNIFDGFNKVTNETPNVAIIAKRFKEAHTKEEVEALLGQWFGETFTDFVLGKVFIELYDAQNGGADHAFRTQKLEAFSIILQTARDVGIEDSVFLDRIDHVVASKRYQNEPHRKECAVQMLKQLITGHFAVNDTDANHLDECELVLPGWFYQDSTLIPLQGYEVHYRLSHNESGFVEAFITSQLLGAADLV